MEISLKTDFYGGIKHETFELEMRSTMIKQKHLTLSDRNDFQLGLERGETFKAIGQSILKDPTTVSKEVKRNRQIRSRLVITFLALYSTKLPSIPKEDKKGRSFENFLNYLDLEVTKHLYDIENTLHQANKDFFQLFPVILTDNGGEFVRVDDIEMDIRGESKLFFYDPNGLIRKAELRKITR